MVTQCGTPIIVSACLAGMRTRYDGGCCERPRVMKGLSESDFIIPLCPEQLGGLPTPRQPAEITRGDGRSVIGGRAEVIRADGANVTSQY
ncbi:MAG: 2-thiouracil desulfurase family protein, partial [Planctomycetota bacterium]